MTIRLLDQLVAIFLAGFGIYLIWSGIGYGYMQGSTPGPGLFPAIFGVVIAVLSAINLLRSILGREKLTANMTLGEVLKASGIILAIAIFIVLVPLIGMTLSAMLMMMAIGLILRPTLAAPHILRLGMISILLPLVCLALFDWLLKVPVPKGPFGF